MTTDHIEKFVNALACDLEEGGFRQVGGTTLRRSLTEAVSAALPLLQPAELAEQQGVDLPPLPEMGVTTTQRCMGNDVYVVPVGFSKQQMQDYARATLSAAGKQQVGEVQGDARAKFETWATGRDMQVHRRDVPGLKRKGQYGNLYTEDAWQAWQAALAARQPGAQVPVSAKDVRQFIADRAPNSEHREDVLSGDYDHTDWFAHVAAALSQGENS